MRNVKFQQYRGFKNELSIKVLQSVSPIVISDNVIFAYCHIILRSRPNAYVLYTINIGYCHISIVIYRLLSYKVTVPRALYSHNVIFSPNFDYFCSKNAKFRSQNENFLLKKLNVFKKTPPQKYKSKIKQQYEGAGFRTPP